MPETSLPYPAGGLLISELINSDTAVSLFRHAELRFSKFLKYPNSAFVHRNREVRVHGSDSLILRMKLTRVIVL